MGSEMGRRSVLERQLDEAIKNGAVDLADRLCGELYEYEEPAVLLMPDDFPGEIASLSKKERENMKYKIVKKLAATAAALVIVLSFGVTAYANGWVSHIISVIEGENMVVAGEQGVDLETYDAQRADTQDREYEFPDFSQACEAMSMPEVFPGALTSYSQKGSVTVLEVDGEQSAVNILSQYYLGNKYVDMNYSYEKDGFDSFIAKYCDNTSIEESREFTSALGYTFTIVTTATESEIFDEAMIAVNDYLYQICFRGFSDREIEAVLDSLDLSPLVV